MFSGGRKRLCWDGLTVHKMFRSHPGCLLNILCRLNLHHVPRRDPVGIFISCYQVETSSILPRKTYLVLTNQ